MSLTKDDVHRVSRALSEENPSMNKWHEQLTGGRAPTLAKMVSWSNTKYEESAGKQAPSCTAAETPTGSATSETHLGTFSRVATAHTLWPTDFLSDYTLNNGALAQEHETLQYVCSL